MSGVSDDGRKSFVPDRRASYFVKSSNTVKTRAYHPGPASSPEASRVAARCSISRASCAHLLPDFNFHPGEPGYALLAGDGDALTPAQERLLAESRVVHVSVDPSVPLTGSAVAETNEDDDVGGAESDPDRVITNAREALPADGLLSSPELAELFVVPTRPRSLYDEGQRLLEKTSGTTVLRCGERLGLPAHQRGAYEPEWTSYTHYWKSVLGESWALSRNVISKVKPFCRLHLGHRSSRPKGCCHASAPAPHDRQSRARAPSQGCMR
jgi:hypothetical protein